MVTIRVEVSDSAVVVDTRVRISRPPRPTSRDFEPNDLTSLVAFAFLDGRT
jgi:hypothetical protein